MTGDQKYDGKDMKWVGGYFKSCNSEEQVLYNRLNWSYAHLYPIS